jgi:hypothetical protein
MAKGFGNKKQKLLWIGDCCIPSGFGRVSESILSRIHENYDLTVMAINYWGQGHNFPFTCLPASTKNPQDPYGFEYLEELFLSVKPDIVVGFNDVWILHRYWEIIKKYKNTNPFKWITYFPVDGGGWFPEVLQWFDDVDLAITYTDFAANVVKDGGYKGRVEVLEHGIDSQIFFPLDKTECRKAIGKMTEDEFIVFNGNRNQPRKRIDLTIMAFAKFAVGKPNAKLYLHMGVKDCGWDIIPLFNYEMKKNGLDPQDRLYLSGLDMTPEKNSITPETLNIIYNSVDVGINTSEGEGWGLVPFEHAATGTPQVVPNYAASADIFANSGELADIAFMGKDINYGIDRAYVSIDSIVDKLNKLYEDKEYCKNKGNKCLLMTQKKEYQWENVSQKMHKFIQSA